MHFVEIINSVVAESKQVQSPPLDTILGQFLSPPTVITYVRFILMLSFYILGFLRGWLRSHLPIKSFFFFAFLVAYISTTVRYYLYVIFHAKVSGVRFVSRCLTKLGLLC